MSKSIQSWRTLYNLINSLASAPLSNSSSTHHHHQHDNKTRRHSSSHDHHAPPTSYRSTSHRRYMYYAPTNNNNIPSREKDDDENLSICSLTLSSSTSLTGESEQLSHFSRASLSSSSSGRTRLYTRSRRDIINQRYNNNRNCTSGGGRNDCGEERGGGGGGASGRQDCHHNHHHHHHQCCKQSSKEEQQQRQQDVGPVGFQKNNSYMTTSSCTHSHSHSTWSLLNSHAKAGYICSICQLHLPSEEALQTHITHYNHHNTQQQSKPHKRRRPPPSAPKVHFRCYTCEASFDTRTQLIAHLEHYHPTKFMCCPHCEAIFSKASHCETHVRKAHSKLHCYRCGMVAQDEESLIEHYNDYHLKCKYCLQRFPFLWVHQQKCPARKLQ